MSIGESLFIVRGKVPTLDEERRLERNRKRILDVIRARWMALGLLAVYGIYLKLMFTITAETEPPISHQLVPFIAFFAVVIYNLWYNMTFKWWMRVRFTNELQILLDTVVVTVLIHYSGGVHSWFWAMYMLLTLEAAFLIDDRKMVWLIGAFGSLLFGALLTAEYFYIIEPVEMPFENPALQHHLTYEMITWGWVLVMNLSVALIGTFMMKIALDREEAYYSQAIRDTATGLYNQAEFKERLEYEIRRCGQHGRKSSLIIIGFEGFFRIREEAGKETTDRILARVAGVLSEAVKRYAAESTRHPAVAFRCTGYLFGVILPDISPGSREKRTDAGLIAKTLRMAVESLRLEEHRLKAAAGVVGFPRGGAGANEIFALAEEAMMAARAAGGDRVEVSPA